MMGEDNVQVYDPKKNEIKIHVQIIDDYREAKSLESDYIPQDEPIAKHQYQNNHEPVKLKKFRLKSKK